MDKWDDRCLQPVKRLLLDRSVLLKPQNQLSAVCQYYRIPRANIFDISFSPERSEAAFLQYQPSLWGWKRQDRNIFPSFSSVTGKRRVRELRGDVCTVESVRAFDQKVKKNQIHLQVR